MIGILWNLALAGLEVVLVSVLLDLSFSRYDPSA